MADVRHEAFVDLERGLGDRLSRSFSDSIDHLADRVAAAVEAADFDRAYELVEQISPGRALEGQRRYLRTVLQAAVLSGARSVHPDVREAGVFGRPDRALLDSAVGQLVTLAEVNAAEYVRRAARAAVARAARVHARARDREAVQKAEPVVSGRFADAANRVRVRIKTGGRQMFDLAGSGYVSRMRSYGLLKEMSPGAAYQVQAILDDRTTDICRFMHGRTFTASDGLARIEAGLSSDSPDVWRALSPWPKPGTAGFPTEQDDLGALGLHAPPYHPLCRSILVPVGALAPVTYDDELDTLAADVYARAARADVSTTRDVVALAERVGARFPDALPPSPPPGMEAVREGSLRYYRLRSFDSTRGKIARYVRDKGLTKRRAAESLSDSLRYTYVLDDDRYVAGVAEAVDRLRDDGYRILEFENIWGRRPDYRAVHVLVHPPGSRTTAEIQFHTPQSYHVKQNVTHPVLERLRSMGADDPRRAGLLEEMARESGRVPAPPDVARLDELEEIIMGGTRPPGQ